MVVGQTPGGRATIRLASESRTCATDKGLRPGTGDGDGESAR